MFASNRVSMTYEKGGTHHLPRGFISFLTKIDAILKQYQDARSFSERTNLFKALKEVARSSDISELPSQYAQILHARFGWLRDSYLAYYQELEQRAAHSFLEENLSLDLAFRSNNYALLEQEVARAKITRESIVAFIGCGCVPWTAMGIHKLVGAQVFGFERNPALVELGQRVVQRQGLADSLRLEVAEGAAIDFGRFSHIFLAAMCDKKKTIAHGISHRVAGDCRLLIRSSRTPYQLFYPLLIERYIPEFELVGRAHCDSADELESFIFKKAPG